jgi:hypothetical protein
MSVGEDLVGIAKDGKAVYDAAKKLKEDLDAETKVAKTEVDKLRNFAERIKKVAKHLPDEMTVAQRRAFIKATMATVNARIKEQQEVMDFEELAKLRAQLFTLENQLLKLELLATFDVQALVDPGELDKLLKNIEEAQRQIKTQLKAQGAVRIGIKLAILAIDLGVLVAKAAG